MSNADALNTPDITAQVVRAFVLYALAEFQSGNATTLRITAEGVSFSVSDDGRGHAIDRTVDGSPYLQFIYTHLEYPFLPCEGGAVQLQGIGMSLLNAMCSELSVTVRKTTETLKLTYRDGSLSEELRAKHANEVTGNSVSAQAERQRQATRARPVVLRTFSQPGPWRPAVVARLARYQPPCSARSFVHRRHGG